MPDNRVESEYIYVMYKYYLFIHISIYLSIISLSVYLSPFLSKNKLIFRKKI